MAKFKRVADFEARQIEAISATSSYNVGDVVSYVPSTKTIAKLSNVSDITAAFADGKEVYLLAQSDAVTEKTGTAYKSYAIGKAITVDSSVAKVVVGYAVEDSTNIEF